MKSQVLKNKFIVLINLIFLNFVVFESFSQKFIKATATGNGSGSSWDNALGASSFRATLASGGNIYVAAGNYNVAASGVPDAVILPAGTNLVGGFPANSTGSSISGYNPSVNLTTVNGQDKMIITILSGTYTIKGFVFDNAEGAGAGGSVIRGNSGGLLYNWTIEDCVIKNTTGSGGGGGAVWLHGAYIAGSKLKVKNCIFDNNVAIAGSYSGALTLQGIANNSGGPAGGSNNGEDYVVEGCSFSNNRVTAGGSGGAMMILSCTGINLKNNSFCGNFANNDAGALLVSSVSKFVMNGCTFKGNSNQGQWSPAVWILSSPESQVLNCTFEGNFAANGALQNNAGGGLAIESATNHLVDGCKFYNNTVNNRGGAIQFSGGGSITVSNSVFKGNKVTNSINAFGGGAIFATSGSTSGLIFENNVFDSNTLVDNTSGSGVGGGAIHVQGGGNALSKNSVYFNNSYNGSTTGLKSDISIFGGGTFTVNNSKLQLSQGIYTSFYNVSTGNEFSNTTNPNVAALVLPNCPTALSSPCSAGNTAPTLSSNTSSNVCPATSVNLSSLVTSTCPSGSVLKWYNSNTPSLVSEVSNPNSVGAGVYFPACFDASNSCWGPTTSNGVTVTIGTCTIPAAGSIDCSKTQIFSAPKTGISGQKTLVVSINVTTSGCLSPINLSGSGFTLANGITNVCSNVTGIQEFFIPVNYDGSALSNLVFSVGNSGSCSSDLTLKPKNKISEVWTLDCVPIVGPSLK